MVGVDVSLPFEIASVDASIGPVSDRWAKVYMPIAIRVAREASPCGAVASE